MEEPYTRERDEMGRFLRCLGGARFSLQIRCSPSGEWEIHPTYDLEGSMCLVNPSQGLHRVLFSFPREAGWQGVAARPNEYFWAGDGSGVYLYFAGAEGDQVPRRFVFVSAPEGQVVDLTAPAFFPSDDFRRQVELLGSPQGTRDLVALEMLRQADDIMTYRLCTLDLQGRELQCLDELQAGLAVAKMTPQAILIRFGRQPETADAWWRDIWAEARVYRPGPDGRWGRAETYSQVATPLLRRDCVTLIEMHQGRPWLKQIGPAGSGDFLFPVPEDAARNRSGAYCWDDRGQCLFFVEWKLLVRVAG